MANETIVKRAEENVVHVIEDIDKVDQEQLQSLIEDSFGRPLAAGYLENLKTDLYPSLLLFLSLLQLPEGTDYTL